MRGIQKNIIVAVKFHFVGRTCSSADDVMPPLNVSLIVKY